MKRILILLGLVVSSVCAGAASYEEMTMYATLSAPIASFWEVQTEGNSPMVMSTGILTLGARDCVPDRSSTGGTINLMSTTSAPSSFSVQKLILNEESSSSFQVGSNNDGSSVRWYLNELAIGQGASATFGGDLIVKTLTIPTEASIPNLTLTVNGALYLDSALRVTVMNPSFSDITLGSGSSKFVFKADEKTELTGTTAKKDSSNNTIYIEP